MAATTSPPPARTGTAMQYTPAVYSPSSSPDPRVRMMSRPLSSASTEDTVRVVKGRISTLAMRRRSSAGSRYASSTLPRPVAYAGSRAPTWETSRRVCSDSTFAT